MSEVKRYTAWAAEVALPRGTMIVLAADYDELAAERQLVGEACAYQVERSAELHARVAELEGLLREAVNDAGIEVLGSILVERIDVALADQQQQGERCDTCDGSGDVHRADGEWMGYCDCASGWLMKARSSRICAVQEEPHNQPARLAGRDDLLKRAACNLEILDRRPRSMCRDCADCNGICQNTGLDCDVPALIARLRAALAPAAVVMPERMTTIPEGKTISYAAGYEAALDVVASLNRNTVPLELLRRISQWPCADHTNAIDELRAILAGAKP